jgi:4-amino-4-deoxy-L-arabinose transferase-like glycosyltransferase
VTRRELAWLVPLLALYIAALAFFPAHPDDEDSYVALAERLTHGSYVTGDADALLDANSASPDLWFGPGEPAALTPLVAVDAPIWLLRLTGPAFLFAAVVLFYLLVCEGWGRKTALVASYGLGLYPPFWPLLANVHSEPLAVLLMVAAMLGIARYLRAPRSGPLALAAGALAGLALTRVAYGLVLTVVLAASAIWWLVRRSDASRGLTIVTAIALALCVPWLSYTYAKTGDVYQWGNSGSLSLYWMASPYAQDRGDWRQADDVFTDPGLRSHRAFFASLRGLTLVEQNARIEREALRNIAHHPGKYVENVGWNVSRLLFNTPYSDSAWKPNDLFYGVSNSLLVLALAFSAVVLVPRRGSLPVETAPFVLIAGAGLLVHLAVATYPRMLAPLLPIAVWLVTVSAVRIGWLPERSSRRPRMVSRRPQPGLGER